MDTHVNFSKIGFFVIGLFILMLGFIFWLGKYGLQEKKYDHYSIFFTESVSGLNVESPIKYKGVQVGNVSEIKINPSNSEEIEVQIEIKKGTPIKQDNIAVLSSLGLTGLKYIELQGGNQDALLLEANEDGIKVIDSKTSVIASLEESTEDITKELTEVLGRTKRLFNEQNLKHISQIVQHGANSMQNIEQFSHYLSKKEALLDEMIKSITQMSKTSTLSFENMDSSAQSVEESAESFQELSTVLIQEIQKGTYDSKESFNKLNKALNSLDKTLLQTQDLVEELRQSPSDILFKQTHTKYGPGE